MDFDGVNLLYTTKKLIVHYQSHILMNSMIQTYGMGFPLLWFSKVQCGEMNSVETI